MSDEAAKALRRAEAWLVILNARDRMRAFRAACDGATEAFKRLGAALDLVGPLEVCDEGAEA